MSKISVIIPLYNDATHIGQCLASVCNQTISNQLEVVIVDDCSTDNGSAIVFDSLDGFNVCSTVISLAQNRGVANARRVGIDAAKGDFIMFCDSDDWMAPQMCELMLSKAEAEGCDMVVCDYNSVCCDKVEAIGPCFKENFLQQLILCRVTGSICNKLVRASILKRPDFIYPDHDFSEDHVYSVQFAMFADKIGYVPIPLYNYVKRPDSLVRSRELGRVRKRYDDDLANLAVELAALEKAGLLGKYCEEIVVRKLQTKNAYCQDKVLWMNAFPGLWKEVFQSSYVPWRSKMIYLLRSLGLR